MPQSDNPYSVREYQLTFGTNILYLSVSAGPVLGVGWQDDGRSPPYLVLWVLVQDRYNLKNTPRTFHVYRTDEPFDMSSTEQFAGCVFQHHGTAPSSHGSAAHVFEVICPPSPED
jgi:hypothetical protein